MLRPSSSDPRHFFAHDHGYIGAEGGRQALIAIIRIADTIEEVSLSHNLLEDEGVTVLFGGLRRLRDNTSGLQSSNKLRRLKKITLSGNQISNKGLRAISQYLVGDKALKELYLPNNRLETSDGMLEFGRAIAHSIVSVLNLNTNHITPEALSAFLEGLAPSQCSSSRSTGLFDPEEGTTIILPTPRRHQLIDLQLNHINDRPEAGDSMCRILARFLADPTRSRDLCNLEIHSMAQTWRGVASLSLAVCPNNFTLRVLAVTDGQMNGWQEIRNGPSTTSEAVVERTANASTFANEDLLAEEESYLSIPEIRRPYGTATNDCLAAASLQKSALPDSSSISSLGSILRSKLNSAMERNRRIHKEIRRTLSQVLGPVRIVLLGSSRDPTDIGKAVFKGMIEWTNETSNDWRGDRVGEMALPLSVSPENDFLVRVAVLEHAREVSKQESGEFGRAGKNGITPPSPPPSSRNSTSPKPNPAIDCSTNAFPLLQLPHEVVIHILRHLSDDPDLLSERQWSKIFSFAQDRRTMADTSLIYHEAMRTSGRQLNYQHPSGGSFFHGLSPYRPSGRSTAMAGDPYADQWHQDIQQTSNLSRAKEIPRWPRSPDERHGGLPTPAQTEKYNHTVDHQLARCIGVRGWDRGLP